MLNTELEALTAPIQAPNKDAMIRGTRAVAFGNLQDHCGILISHEKSDAVSVYDVIIFDNRSADVTASPVESRNALDVDTADNGYGNPYAQRQHVSIAGIDYLLKTTHSLCVAKPVQTQG